MKTHPITSILLGIVLLGITGCAPHPTTATVREQASDALWAERYGEAETLYGELAERFPQDWRVQYGFGVSAMHTGNLSEARQALEIAHTLRPANRDIAVDLAEVMFLQDDRNGLFLFLHDRAQSRSDSRDWLLLAEYSLMTEDPDSARECIEKAMVVDHHQGCRKKIMHGSWLSWRTRTRANEYRPISNAPPERRTIIFYEQCSQPSSCLLVAGAVGLAAHAPVVLRRVGTSDRAN